MSQATLQTYARCGGVFPGPGINKEGKSYCCGQCAQGPMGKLPRMMSRMLPVALLVMGAGIIIGRSLGQHE